METIQRQEAKRTGICLMISKTIKDWCANQKS